MKKIKGNIKLIIGLILGIFISAITSYAVAETLIKSADVTYVDNSKLGATNVQAAIDGTCTKFSNELSNFLNKIYPVGSIYISTANTNPSTFLGGTWENYADGRVLKGIKSGTAGTTGGSSTVTLSMSNIPAHTHNYDKSNSSTEGHQLTIAEMPSHSHEGVFVNETKMSPWSSPGGNLGAFELGSIYTRESTQINTVFTGAAGGNSEHSHVINFTSKATTTAGSTNPTAISVQDPYITVYMWRRTK